jgi:hypothetical protein
MLKMTETHFVVLDWEEYESMAILFQEGFLVIRGDAEITDETSSIY